MTRLLVVTPRFHGYGDSIARSFERIGYETTVHHYDHVDSAAKKAWNKFRHELPSRLAGDDLVQSPERVTAGAVAAVRRVRPDVVLVVRGDVLGMDFWAEAAASGRRVAAWLYDEVRRTPRFDPAAVSAFAALATYSPGDAKDLSDKGIRTLYVPTGYDDERPVAPCCEAARGVVSFVGAPLPGRVAALETLRDAGVPVRAWGRGWSDHPIDRARTWRMRGRGIPNERDVPGETALAIMRDSYATLNVHGDQDGFTMRTFESCAVGGVQLIDRADVSEFYEPGREVLVFESREELVELAHRVVARPREFDDLRERARERTLAEHTFVHRARRMEQLWA